MARNNQWRSIPYRESTITQISKFYFHDAATTNTGTMPGAGDAYISSNDATGDATNARIAKAASDTIGTLETSSVITSVANVSAQGWGHRRFVSAPLAAVTFGALDGNWTFSFAANESNTSHNGGFRIAIYPWRPSTGLQVGTALVTTSQGLSTTTKTAFSVTGAWNGTQAILNGDILVFEISDVFTQAMATAYTSTFFYDGTTEASTVSCASFVTPPAALTLFTAPVPATPLPLHQSIPFYPRASRPS